MLRQLSSCGSACLAMTIDNFASPKTIDDMIVDHPRGLHVRIADRRADKFEASVLVAG